MSSFSDNFERHVVPRWRDSSITAHSPDLLPIRKASRPVEFASHLDEKLAEFRDAPSVGVGADVAFSALLEGKGEALREVSDLLLAEESSTPDYLRRQVEAGVGLGKGAAVRPEGVGTTSRVEIARIRSLLWIEPRNPVLLMDMARHQASLGQADRAERAARTAVAQAPNNRWILRSASKLLASQEKALEAHQLLVRAKATAYDPWLVAAELATAQAANVSPKFWRHAQSFLRDRAMGPEHLSELASAVGTFELLDGKKKRAKEWFALSMTAPTDNALAQAKWAERKTQNGFHVEEKLASVSRVYEAACLSAYNEQDISRALDLGKQWMDDEPFSTAPASMTSYLASLMDDYDGVLETTSRGLMVAPSDHCMYNNRIFALISSGTAFDEDKDEVRRWFFNSVRDLQDKKFPPGPERTHLLANLGLLLYRMGDFENGRDFYDRAAEQSRSPQNGYVELNALMFHAREAILAKQPWATELLNRAKKLAANVHAPGSRYYLDKMDVLAKNPDKADEILSPMGYTAYQEKRRVLIPSYRVEKTADGIILWVPGNRGSWRR